MKLMIGLTLATGLAMLVAGCSGQGGNGSFPSGPGDTSSTATRTAVPAATRNFNLAVRCPGVHWEKAHGWPDTQIMQQQSVEKDEITACEQWAAAQPKGYVPPPPPGVPPAPGAAKAAPSPAGAPSPAAAGGAQSSAAGAPAPATP
jgi:hypothetical protein